LLANQRELKPSRSAARASSTIFSVVEPTAVRRAANPDVDFERARIRRVEAMTALDTYHLLGRSGLRISPLALGTMTFGSGPGWGTDETEARHMFDAYVGRGGNFVDTADIYADGKSERFIGDFAKDRRDRLVIATKYSLAAKPGDPNAGGNHRKSMVRAVEGSLERLQTDHIDLLYLHAWDAITRADEILRAMDDLVRAGKVLYVGISDTPAWQVARMQTTADLRGWSPLVALQIEYSLAERTVERELLPMACELGLGVVPWSPLANGVLTGKYTHDDLTAGDASGTRRDSALASGRLSERSLAISDVVGEVADECGHTRAQVALAWTLLDRAVSSTIVGARTLNQLEDNLGALDVSLTAEQRARLDAVSAVDLGFPHELLRRPHIQSMLYGGATIVPRR
jgi:aryl-alcohol dehydrogenase-like predicted oxidoreductase